MTKQSRSAITMLLSALKSVYRNAYVKGIASAVVLTAGLSAGAANAENTDSWASSYDKLTTDNKVLVNTGTLKHVATDKQYTSSIDVVGNPSSTVTYTISGGSSAAIFSTGGLNILNRANVNVISNTNLNLTDDFKEDGTPNRITGDAMIRGTGSILALAGKGSIQAHNITIDGGQLNLADTASVTDNLVNFTQAWANHGGQISLRNNGEINLTGYALVGADRGINLDSGTVTFSGSAANSAIMTVTGGNGAAINVNGADVKVTGHADMMADTINISSADSVIDIESTGNLTLGGQTPTQVLTDGSAHYTSAAINMTAGTINNAGTLTIKAGEGTIDWDNVQKDEAGSVDYINTDAGQNTVFNVTGGTINNAGTINVNGEMSVVGSAKLVATSANSAVNVSGADAVFAIGLDNLTSYLTADDSSNQGGVLVSGGTFEFTDAKVNLSELSDDSVFASGSSVTAGKITIDTEGTLKGNEVSITSELSGFGAADITIDARSLRLGNNTAAGVSAISELYDGTGTLTLVSHGDVNFDGENDTFAIDEGGLTVIGDGDTAARLTGDNLVLGSATQAASAVTVNLAGNVEITRNVSFTGSGSQIKIGKTEDGTTDYEGNTTVTLTGTLTAGGGNKVSTFLVGTEAVDEANDNTPYTATLNLTKAPLKADTSGTGAVAFAANQNGVIKFSDSQINRIVDEDDELSKVYQIRANQGVVDIAGTLKADFNDLTSDYADGKISMKPNGTLKADGAILSQQSGAAQDLSLHNGTLDVDTLEVSDLNTETQADGSTPYVDDVTITSGDYLVGSSLTSKNGTVIVGEAAHLILGDDTASAGTVAPGLKITGTSEASVDVNGTWTLTDIEVGTNGTLTVNGADYNESGEVTALDNLTADSLTVTGGTVRIGNSSLGQAKFTTVNAATGSITVAYGSEMTINGDAEISKDDPLAATAGVTFGDDVIKVNGGTVTFGQPVADKLITQADDGTITAADGIGTVTMNGGDLNLSFSSRWSFDKDEAADLRTALVSGASADDYIDGVINVGNAILEINGLATGSVKYEDYKPFSDVAADVTSAQLLRADITEVTSSASDGFRGNVGSVSLAENETGLTLGYDSSLNYAAGNEGKFVADSNGSAADIDLNSHDLELNNGGETGVISGTGSVSVDGSGQVTEIAGIDGITSLSAENGTVNVGTEASTASYVSAGQGATVNFLADETTLQIAYASEGGVLNFKDLNAQSIIASDGTVTAVDISDATSISATDDGVIRSTGFVQMAQNGTITIGSAPVYDPEDSTKILEEATSGFFVANILNLNGGSITLDPAYGDTTAIGSVTRFDTDEQINNEEEAPAGLINGSIYIYSNSALGVGTTDENEVLSYIRGYQVNGSLQKDVYGAMLVVGKAFDLENNEEIVLSAEYGNDFRASETYTGLQAITADNKVYFGDNTALLVNSEALGVSAADDAAVTFNDDTAKLVADGGDVVIAGEVRASTDYKIFATSDGTGLSVVNIDNEVTTAENGITVTTENGLLQGTLFGDGANAGTAELVWNAAEARSILGAVSDPVFKTIAAYANGANDWESETPEDVLYNGYTADEANPDAVPVKNTDYSNALLTATLNSGNGSAAEAAARMAVYGGAVEAALVAGQTSSDAIASRMGMGNPSSVLTYADNADGAGIWLAPVYRNHESDGFDAQGVDYGADLDLYGVALGVDYTFAQGFRAGVMFNIGSGDADGQGAGSSVSNDFDYWGVGVYGGYAYENFSITADLGYTVVDNDLDASSGYADIGSMEASTDTESLSLGLTAQYKFALDALDITPHVGARFTRIDMDDYSVNSKAGTLAEFSADSMNVFSVPVGVSFSKDIVSGDWSVQPALDLVVTANTGDDEFDGDVAWSGVSNLTTATSTEVLDSFTYGANLGISVKNASGLSLGLGVNYVGSDNTDEFGAQASVRYAF